MQPLPAVAIETGLPDGHRPSVTLVPDRASAISRLAGGVAHEFNNLLMVISGHAELLLDKLPPDHPARADAASIATAIDLAARVTGQLLAVSERQVLVPVFADLNVVVTDAISRLPAAARARVSLHTDLQPALPFVSVDRAQMTHAVSDVLGSAIEATPAGGRMIVTTSATEDLVTVTVADGGIGMADHVRARVFEPFAPVTPMGHRSGLALAAARGVAQQSGGRLTATGQPGCGTIFTLTLPVACTVDGDFQRERAAGL